MQKTKTQYGIIEAMPNGKIFGVVNLKSFSTESKIINEYINLGYVIKKIEYKLVGGSTGYIVYHYYDSISNTTSTEEVDTIEYGMFVMRTELKKYVSNTSE